MNLWPQAICQIPAGRGGHLFPHQLANMQTSRSRRLLPAPGWRGLVVLSYCMYVVATMRQGRVKVKGQPILGGTRLESGIKQLSSYS